jgi:phosphoribosyl 1,2-cyclic phosphodiesterase
MQFCSLGSGSQGNSFLVRYENCCVLIDCGFGLAETEKRLVRHQINPNDISAILLTHEHEDHVRGAFSLSNKYKLPIYLTHGTYRMCEKRNKSSFNIDFKFIVNEKIFYINNLSITPITVPHDAREPVQFKFVTKESNFAIITDLVFVSKYLLKSISNLNSIVIECNHVDNLLNESDYPESLKNRIGGKYGHLNNKEAARILQSIKKNNLNFIGAAHLSEKNNNPNLVKRDLSFAVSKDESFIKIINQDDGLNWTTV